MSLFLRLAAAAVALAVAAGPVAAADPAPLLAALRGLQLAPETFVWIAAEAHVARLLRSALRERGHPLSWLKAAGYWVEGQTDASDKEIVD